MAQRYHLYWSSKLLLGTMLIGFGVFNVIEGLVDHHLLGIHHVNEIVDPAYRFYFDAGFILWGLLMLIIGWILLRQGQRQGEPEGLTHQRAAR